MSPSCESERLDRQAADWIARLHADDRSVRDEANFSRWIAASPAHAEAFDRASVLWEMVGGVPAPRDVGTRPLSRSVSRRLVLAGGTLCAAAGVAVLGWREFRGVEYRTAIGEQRRIVLEDGTRMALDTLTHVRFRAVEDLRTLWLVNGRIDLEIADDPRPYVIDAGARRAYAQDARLDVRRDGDRVALTLLAGSARVSAPTRSLTLREGERVAISPDQALNVDRPELQDLSAWQSGRLVFRNEPLAVAVSEMNRYSKRPLVISDPQIARLHVSGVYRVGDAEEFARSLAVLLSLQVQATPDVVRLSAAV